MLLEVLPRGSIIDMKIPIHHIRLAAWRPHRVIPTLSPAEVALARRFGADHFGPAVVGPPTESGERDLYSGVRAWLAAQMLGQSEIAAVERHVKKGEARGLIARDVLAGHANPMAMAHALTWLKNTTRDARGKPLSERALAKTLGMSASSVHYHTGLLDLPADIQDAIAAGHLSLGHAKVLHALPAPAASRLAKAVAARGYTVRQTEELARRLRAAQPGSGVAQGAPDAAARQNQYVADKISTVLGIPCTVVGQSPDITVAFQTGTLEVLEGLLERLGVDLGDM